MYVINVSLNIAIWRSISAYILKYAHILVMWSKSFCQHYGVSLRGTSLSYSDESHWLLQSWSVHSVHNITQCINMKHSKGGRGTQWCSWLWHCAANWKVTGSIPYGVIGIFHWYNPSGRTLALGLTHPLTEMSTRNISWGCRRPVLRADKLTTLMCRLSWNLGASTFWNP